MLWEKPKCYVCKVEINGDDLVYAKMRYPERKGFTEIIAYLRNNAEFMCNTCFIKRPITKQP